MKYFGYRKIKSIFIVVILILVLMTIVKYITDETLNIVINDEKNQEADHITSKNIHQESENHIIETEKINDVPRTLIELGDLPVSQELQEKRNFVKVMMKKAWKIYETYAWGANEVNLDTLSELSRSDIFRSLNGVTIVDSLDTLYIMGLMEEFEKGQEWVANSLYLHEGQNINLFETNIRITGGLISAYYLTNNKIFLNKALQLVNLTLPAFSDIIPLNHVILSSKSHGSTSGRVCIAEFGTLYLEYAALTYITNNKIYIEKVKNIRKKIYDFYKNTNQSLRSYFNLPSFNNFGPISIGAASDSFYEYLVKSHIQYEEDTEGFEFFQKIIPILNHDILKITNDGYYFYSEDSTMGSLSCFTGGMFGIASKIPNITEKDQYTRLAIELTKTCAESCKHTKTNLCPENFNPNLFSLGYVHNSDYYLRPEVMESIFILFRITNDEKYREWGWNIIQKIEHHCSLNGGYSSVFNVNEIPPKKSGYQESFFLAETLKYAYLLFSNPNFISLDKWVFNTEAHPFIRYYKKRNSN